MKMNNSELAAIYISTVAIFFTPLLFFVFD